MKRIVLSPREASVYPFLLTDISIREIGKKVGVSTHTAAIATSRVCDRFGVNGRVALMALHIAALKDGPAIELFVTDSRRASKAGRLAGVAA